MYFSTHGEQNKLLLLNGLFINTGYDNGSNTIGLSSHSMPNMKLIVFDACLTAQGASNLCTKAIEQGANAVVGWQDNIGVDDGRLWEQRFQSACVNGKKIHEAMDYASSFSDYNNNYTIKRHLVYGDWMQVINKNRAILSKIVDEDTRKVYTIPEITFDPNTKNSSVIEETIKNVIPSINTNEYNINIQSTNIDGTNFVIDYLKIIDGYTTNSGYTIVFRDNKAAAIYDNTITNENQLINNKIQIEKLKIISENDVEQAKLAAKEKVKNIGKNSNITQQTGVPFYDVAKNKCYYKVFTVYEYEQTGTFGAFSAFYEIQ